MILLINLLDIWSLLSDYVSKCLLLVTSVFTKYFFVYWYTKCTMYSFCCCCCISF